MKREITIIGAGFSGLSLAVRLIDKGFAVKVLEAGSRPGGLIQTLPLGEAFAEAAANSLIRTERMENFVRHLGLTPLPTSDKAKKRFIFRNRLRRWPLRTGETMHLLGRALLQKLRGRLPPLPQESLHAWGSRNLGHGASAFLLETGMQGIYAGDPEQLSASLLLGPLFQPREKYRGTFSFSKGMEILPQKMAAYVLAHGGQIEYGKKVNFSSLRPPYVVATSAASAADFFSGQEIARPLRKIEMVPIVTVSANFSGYRQVEGFGCLIPRSQNLRALGVLFPSSMYDRQWPQRCESWIFGGATDPSAMNLSDSALLDLLQSEREKIFHRQDELLASRIFRWPQAVPHYNLQLEALLPELESRLQSAHPGVYLHGNYLGGIGLSKILVRTDQLAEMISHG